MAGEWLLYVLPPSLCPSVPPSFPSNLERFSDYGQITCPSWQMAPVRLLVLATSHFLMKSRRGEVGWSWISCRLSFRNDGKGCFSRRVQIQNLPSPRFFIFLPTNWREDDSDLAEGSAGFTVESSPVSRHASLFGFYVLFCVHVGQRVTSGQRRRACGRSRRCWIFIFLFFFLSNTRRTKTSTEALSCCRCSLRLLKLLTFLSSGLAEFKRFTDDLVPIISVPAVICATLPKNLKQKSNSRGSFGYDEIL